MHRMNVIQSAVAHSVRNLGSQPGPREADLFADWACVMVKRGSSEPDAIKQASFVASAIHPVPVENELLPNSDQVLPAPISGDSKVEDEG